MIDTLWEFFIKFGDTHQKGQFSNSVSKKSETNKGISLFQFQKLIQQIVLTFLFDTYVWANNILMEEYWYGSLLCLQKQMFWATIGPSSKPA